MIALKVMFTMLVLITGSLCTVFLQQSRLHAQQPDSSSSSFSPKRSIGYLCRDSEKIEVAKLEAEIERRKLEMEEMKRETKRLRMEYERLRIENDWIEGISTVLNPLSFLFSVVFFGG